MKKEILDENRLFGNPLNETDIYQVPPVDENGNVHMFSAEQLAAIYDIVKPLLTVDELQEFNDMTPEDKEQYLTGFGANIQEWQKAKDAANKPDDDQDDPNMQPMTPPDDGLDHWAPAKRKKNKSQQQQNQQRMNPIYSDLQDELDKIDQETQQAQQNSQQSHDNNSNEANDAQDIANNAQDIADSAQKMADAAQAAADAAQEAANQADENAQESGDYKDIKNADKSQVSADAAQDLADQAKEAANRAKQLAADAQQAAEEGNTAEAARKAKEAYDAANEAYNKTSAAKINAKDAISSSKQTDPAGNGQQNGQGQNGSDGGQHAPKNGQSADGEFGDGEQVVCGSPEGDGLQIGAAYRNVVAERDVLEFQVTAILDPTVGEAAVAHRVEIRGAWDVGLLSLVLPAVEHGSRLVVEITASLKQAALVVEDIIAQRVVEAYVERQVLPGDIGKDVTIDVGIGVANDGLVGLTDFSVTIDVNKLDITSLEVLLGSSAIGQEEVTLAACRRCLLVIGQHSGGLVSVEHAGSLAHNGGNVVGAVDRRGITLCRLLSTDIQHIVIRQRLHLVDIVAGTGANLYIHLACDDWFGCDGNLETAIVE